MLSGSRGWAVHGGAAPCGVHHQWLDTQPQHQYWRLVNVWHCTAQCHRKIHIFWLLRRARILNITLTMKGSTLLWSPSFYDNNNHYTSIVIELQTLFNTSRSNLLIVKLSWKSWLDLLTGPGEQGGPLEFRTLEQLLANFDKYQISRLNLKTRHPTDKIKIIIKKSR